MGVTAISIEWNEVECADRNGDITSYSVRYEPSSTPSSYYYYRRVETISDPNSRTFSVGGREIAIGTSYNFEVAAVNENGIGPYNITIMVTIPVPSGM